MPPVKKEKKQKGNQNGEKDSGRMAPQFTSPEALEAKVEEYFNLCKGVFHIEYKTKVERKTGEEIELDMKVWDVEPEPVTITGLVLHLGFVSRQALGDYEKRDDRYADIIKSARTRVEHFYEKSLSGGKPTGAIFALKNMGWRDRLETNEETATRYKLLDGSEEEDLDDDDNED